MGIKHLVKIIILKLKWHGKVKFGYKVQIALNSFFEGMNQIHPNTKFSGYLGYGSYIGPYCDLNGRIGRFTSIAPLVRCNYGRHPFSYPYVSTAPCFYSINPNKSQNGNTFASKQTFEEIDYADSNNQYPIVIGNDCWIGEGAFLVGGIKIEDGAVVLAHAVVTKNVPPYAIVGGVPAKILGFRYSEEDIKFLLETKWWNNNSEWFKTHWELLCDFNKFKRSIDKHASNKKIIEDIP